MATLGRNIVFPIKNADGTPFHDLVLRKATVDSVVMSLGDKITGDVYYKDNTLQCTMQEYVEYKTNPNDPNENPIKYTIVNPPTIVREGLVKDNSDLKGMTKYSFEFYHPMYQLSNFPFTDVATKSGEEKYLSQNKTFSWIGKPQDYINKINKNIEGTEWIVVKSDRFPREKNDELSDVLSFDNNTIADALKTGYETWGLPYVVSQINRGEPYYSQGKRFKVEFGLPSNEILVDNEPYIFQFGQGVGLKNNSRTPRNNKIITRIAGYGSENNIPYGYPQIRWYGDQSATQTPAGYPIYDGIVGGVVRKLIKHPFTRTHLMPSIYTQTVFNKVSPYLANGSNNPNYNPNIEIIDYYDAVYSQEYQYINEINLLAPSYEIHEFADIKPELDSDRQLGIVSAIPLNQDLTPASKWDDTYDAEKDKYVQSYFKITLPQLSFDLYPCASIMEEMQVNMRSGACLGCTFPIQVDWEDYKKNFYDADGNFLPDGSQRDLTKYPKSNLGQIDIIVQKETQTFGTLMPNIYQQPRANDLFVILGISMPVEYITNAEERLDDAMKSYMLENNVYYYDYPLKFDEHFLATHTNILAQIRPNSIIRFGFKGYPTPLELFVKQITVKYGDDVLPQYDITLTDNIEIVLNQIGQVADDVEKLGSLVAILRQTYNRNIWSELDKKLSKVKDDSTPHKLGMGEMQVDGDGEIGNDLSVGGDLSVAGDTELNGDVTIGNSASDEALIKAIAKVFQQIKSNNYSGDSPFDVGWMIKNADANHGNASYMVIDNLFVRMKAIFTELEIRKISYAGGNIILSHAGSTLVKVVPLTTTMHPTVVDGKLTISGDLARVENGRLILDSGTVVGNRIILDGSQEVLYAYRCYIKKDDGTTATENWWRADDQARCQTFNIDETGTYHDVSNSFYWRRVMNVGSEVPIGETTDEVMDYVDLSALDCITGSTVPQAGDVIVQMGNRTDVSRQGFISLEVYGDDAPAFKVYKNVNGYTLNNKMPIIISPYNTSIRARRLSIETDYDVQIVPMERGDWSLIPEHKCYYYDQVQHNGSTWLCIFPEEGSGGVKYTTEEPSLEANWWKVIAQAGKDGSDGKPFNILGSYDTMAELIEAHPTGSVGDAYIVAGDLVVWDDEKQQWSNSGRIQGETGNGISSATIHYGTSASNTTIPTIWTSNYADLPYTQGEWIWTRVVLSYTDGTSANPYYTQARIGVDGSYKSTAFTRSNKQLSATTPTGGDYSKPLPNQQTVQGEVITWSDGIPAGEAIVWATSRVFTPTGASSGWSTPRQMTDTLSNDVEFSANATKPANPSDNESERDAQGWRDVTRNPSFDFTTAIWRAERTKQNGVWSAWVIEKIKGESITKTSEDVKYALSDSGTVAPQSGWQTTKPTSTDTMRWIWTRTIITWSDTSTTTLYQAERDPNDGIDGMEIVVGTQTIKYAVTDNGSSHPSEDSPLWQDTYTPVQGKWLWSKITTPYIYDGGGSAGTTVSYDVSYIAVDGAKGDKGDKGDTGRGISRVDEYYLAGNSSTTPPTGTWVTNPNNAGWSATNKYLWNYEDVVYTDSTSAPTTKSVVAIWSKDGKGIDSIVNYYKASSNPNEPRPAVDGTEGWTTSIQTISPDAIYLHNYEKITYSDGSTPYRSDSHIIGHWGIDALEASQLILSPSLIAIPTDTDGVVLEDFRQEIEVSMKTYSDILALKSVDFTANENVVVEASTLIAMAWSGASVQNGRLVNVEGSVNNGRLTISADDYAVVPTKIVVKATKGTTLTERTVSITATAWDEDGNEYNGYNELTVQRQYRAEKPQFPSMVFKRSATKPATPTGGTYTNPIPEGWEDGIPSGTGIVWASVCTFYGDGTSSGWSEPQAQIDTDNLDLEFSASSTEPSAPTGDVPFADHESEGWYDPTSPNLPEMVIWRAERKVKNGAYDGDWIVTRIYGEQGEPGTSTYIATIDDPMYSVACTYAGKPEAGGSKVIWVKMWYGATLLPLTNLTCDKDEGSGLTVTIEKVDDVPTGKITFTWATGTKLAKSNHYTITAVAGQTRTVNFSLNGVYAGAEGQNAVTWSLIPVATTITKKKDGTYSLTSNLTCGVVKTVGGNSSVPSASEYNLTMQVDENSEGSYNVIQPSAFGYISKKVTYRLYVPQVRGVLQDLQTVDFLVDGEDGVSVYLESPVTLFTQDINNTSTITPLPSKTNIIVKCGNTTVPLTDYTVAKPNSGLDDTHCTYSVTNTSTEKSVTISAIGTYAEGGKNYYYENGFARVNVTYKGVTYLLDYKFLLNAIGKFKTVVEGDVETSIANKHTYYLNSDGTALESEVDQQGAYIRSAEKNIQRLDEQVNDPTTGLEHKYSEISQNVNNISLKVGQYYNLFYNAFFGELLAERSPYSPTTSISLASEGTYGGKVIRMGGGNFHETITSSIMGSDTKGYGVYLDKGTYTFQMYARVSNDYSSYSSAFAGVQLLWDDNADFSTWSSSKIINRIQVTGTSYARYTYTFTLSSARYVGFRMIIDGISIGGTSFDLYIDAVMLEIGSTASSMVSSYGGNQSGAEVGKVQRKLLATGIDIEKGKITMTADKFECQNNSGVKTAWLDDMGNFTTMGVYNNLATIISFTPRKLRNTDKIISWVENGETYWCLDVLRCGDVVVIESLPSDFTQASNTLWLPFYFGDTNEQTRTRFMRTKTRNGDSSIATPHSITAAEMKQLVGKRMVVIIQCESTSILKLSAHKYTPNGLSLTSPTLAQLAGVVNNLANGQDVASNIEPQDISIQMHKSIQLECKYVWNINNYGDSPYAYIWTRSLSDSQDDNREDDIDSAWT